MPQEVTPDYSLSWILALTDEERALLVGQGENSRKKGFPDGSWEPIHDPLGDGTMNRGYPVHRCRYPQRVLGHLT